MYLNTCFILHSGWHSKFPSCHEAKAECHPGHITSSSQGHTDLWFGSASCCYNDNLYLFQRHRRHLYVSSFATSAFSNRFPRWCVAAVALTFVTQTQSFWPNSVFRMVIVMSPQVLMYQLKGNPYQRGPLEQMCPHDSAAAEQWRWWQLARDICTPPPHKLLSGEETE